MLDVDASSWLFYMKLITMRGHFNIKHVYLFHTTLRLPPSSPCNTDTPSVRYRL